MRTWRRRASSRSISTRRNVAPGSSSRRAATPTTPGIEAPVGGKRLAARRSARRLAFAPIMSPTVSAGGARSLLRPPRVHRVPGARSTRHLELGLEANEWAPRSMRQKDAPDGGARARDVNDRFVAPGLAGEALDGGGRGEIDHRHGREIDHIGLRDARRSDRAPRRRSRPRRRRRRRKSDRRGYRGSVARETS